MKMSYKSHYRVLVVVFKVCGIIVSKVTHLMRGNGARDTMGGG